MNANASASARAASEALFPTTVVGSMPRPQWLKDLFDDFHHGRVSEAERERLLDEAVPYAIALQEVAGVDVVSDGEWRHFSYVAVLTEVASGFQRGKAEDGRYWHTVVDEVKVVSEGKLADYARFAIAHSKRPVKVALPSPYLLSVRMWDEKKSAKAYPTRRDFARAIVPLLAAQVRALADAGVHTVQIDDPHLCLFVDPKVRAEFADADEEAMHCASLIDDVFASVRDRKTFTRAVHLCRRNKGRKGWIGQGSYDAIMTPLRSLHVDQLMMEFTIPAAGDTRCLRDLPEHFKIGLGCVDCRGEIIDAPEGIVLRVEQAMQHVAKERLVLAPDCGFAPGNAADIPVDEAYAKLRNMAEAARTLRDKHG